MTRIVGIDSPDYNADRRSSRCSCFVASVLILLTYSCVSDVVEERQCCSFFLHIEMSQCLHFVVLIGQKDSKDSKARRFAKEIRRQADISSDV